MSDENQPELDTCGCCGDTPLQRSAHENRPGLPAIDYRLATYASFLRRMLAGIHAQPVASDASDRPLAALSTRAPDDPAIALIDAWAVAADVLTFYQERIANEHYLRTATERRSVLELARAIGYELKPGVAAATYLAFVVEDAPGAPGIAEVPAGTQVQSIPQPGKLPQTFETGAAITARAEWNALRPRQSLPQRLAISNDTLYLFATDGSLGGSSSVIPLAASDLYQIGAPVNLSAASVSAVEAQQIYVNGASTGLAAGDLLLFVGRKYIETTTVVKSIHRVVAEPELRRTRIDLVDRPTELPYQESNPSPSSSSATNPQPAPFSDDAVRSAILDQTLSETDLNALVSSCGWQMPDVQRVVAELRTQVQDESGVFGFRQRAGFFGASAPRYSSHPPAQNGDVQPYPKPWDDRWRIWKRYAPSGRAILYSHYSRNEPDVYLERVYNDIAPGSWTIFESPTIDGRYVVYQITDVVEEAVTGFALVNRTTGLKLAEPNGDELHHRPKLRVRTTTAHIQSFPLDLADVPINAPLQDRPPLGKVVRVAALMLDTFTPGLQPGQPVVFSGEQADAPGVARQEVAVIQKVVHSSGYTCLCFAAPLHYSYVRKTVVINANVSPATQGETVREALGSGDGSRANQRFALRKPPLTYTPRLSGGVASSLVVRVDGVRWNEASSLYGLGPRDERYSVRIEDDGTTTLTFGDGASGARLPSGVENVTAVYRSGIGLDGEAPAGSLTLLKTRPFGIRSVSNPLDAGGAQDRERLDEARANAPLTVLTLDRLVSLRDFEDYARAYPGIGKAQAIALWNGAAQVVHITLATASGKPLNASSQPLKDSLITAINAARDPAQTVTVDTYVPCFFNLTARLLIDQRLQFDAVAADVRAALLAAFAFEQRAFGQPVTAAEVIATIQRAPGVVMVDLEKLARTLEGDGASGMVWRMGAQPLWLPPVYAKAPAMLRAETARYASDGILCAELLLINQDGIELQEIKP